MRLTDLEPDFVKIIDDRHMRHAGVTMAEADGLMYLCPKCFVTNGGAVGTHRVLNWKPHVDPARDPKPGRWEMLGTGFHDLTLRAGSSSVLLMGGCNAHFFITDGNIIGC